MPTIRYAAVAVLSSLLLVPPAGAVRRTNEPAPALAPGATPQQQAMNYVHIMDRRGLLDLVSVQWLPPLAMGDASPELRDALAQYVVIAVSHVSVGPAGLVVHGSEMAELQDAQHHRLEPVAEKELPQVLTELLARKRKVLREKAIPDDIGPPPGPARDLEVGFARNLRFYAFRAGGMQQCSQGQLTIRFAGANYTFDTPLPGCTPARK